MIKSYIKNFIYPRNKLRHNCPLKKKKKKARIWMKILNENYLTIQFIFTTIHGPHYTF